MWWSDHWAEDAREALGYVETKTVKQICQEATGLSVEQGYTWQEIIHQAVPHVFDFQFPIHIPQHREGLEALILKKYFFREICCEDVDEWKLRLDAKMNEVMPYFNKLYESMDYLVEIMDDVDYRRVFDEQTTRSGKENTQSTQNVENSGFSMGATENDTNESTDGESIGRFSDTPQGQLTGLMNDTYMSSAQRNTDEQSRNSKSRGASNSQSSGKSDTTGTFDTDKQESGVRAYEERVKGKMYAGSKPKIVMEYQKAIRNIDAEIVRSLSDLFMNVYHNW